MQIFHRIFKEIKKENEMIFPINLISIYLEIYSRPLNSYLFTISRHITWIDYSLLKSSSFNLFFSLFTVFFIKIKLIIDLVYLISTYVLQLFTNFHASMHRRLKLIFLVTLSCRPTPTHFLFSCLSPKPIHTSIIFYFNFKK